MMIMKKGKILYITKVIYSAILLWYNNFAMLGNGLKWSFPNICVTNLLLVEWKFIISTRE